VGSPGGRRIGLLGATGIGVGAIVGGGILALAGVAFATTGPSALLAFGLNGAIALLTALTFAELSTSFPESGGTYAFAKKVFSVETAFAVGWVVWLASIVASVLYALGFAWYAALVATELWRAWLGEPPAWLGGRLVLVAFSVGATGYYVRSLIAGSGAGGRWATPGKVLVFAVVIAGGAWAFAQRPAAELGSLRPFFTRGGLGLAEAMGFTFIALQGFDLIAAVAGEVRDPSRTLPRAMLASLATALLIYLPLLFLIATVGVGPGESITEQSAREPEAIVALAGGRFLGPVGYWLVIVAAILSMLSALQANLLAASRVGLAMARDRTLPERLGRIDSRTGAPAAAVLASAAPVVVILALIPDVAAAGAMSSLIFLISFALAHLTCVLMRRRRPGRRAPFHTPWFPLVPALGGLACLGLAVFQGFAVPAAGLLAGAWLGSGGLLYLVLFARRAGVVDASAQALDPELVQLRGRSPLVLVPIANPARAEALVGVAHALTPPAVGRVLLLSVVNPPPEWQPGEPPPQLVDAQSVVREALTTAFAAAFGPEALTTVAQDAWAEIARVSRAYRCESLLLGLGDLERAGSSGGLEWLMGHVGCDVVILRAPPGWRLAQVRRVLVPVGGRRDHSRLRARLLGSMCRAGEREITFLGVLPDAARAEAELRAARELRHLARDEAPAHTTVDVVRSDRVDQEIARRAVDADLVVLGLKRGVRRERVLGDVVIRIARATPRPILLISQPRG
jgi:basic amino acid/polyamine antiporter, APA family